MKIFIPAVFLVLSSVASADEFTCYQATDPDCVRTTSSSVATGEHYIGDLIVNHEVVIAGGKIGETQVSMSFPKDGDVVSLTIGGDQAPIPLGRITDAGDLGKQSFYFLVDPGVSFSSRRIGTKKRKVCDPSSFGGSSRYTNIYAVIETTVTVGDRKVKYVTDKFIDNENNHWSIFKCPGGNE